MNISIRRATKADAERIADLSRQTFYDAFIADNKQEDMDKFMNEQFTKEGLMAEVGAEGNTFFLAYANDELAGYAVLKDKSVNKLNNAIELARLYAVTHKIGKGIGKALMQSCINEAKKMQKDWIWLGVWEKNPRAIDFYEKFGFEKFDEHDFILGDDRQTDWLMKKQLQ